jgi:glutathione synthase/RimK-type ligase-like ATP-grasp enzyme
MQENSMVAIHERSGSFSDRWIEVCEGKGIPFKIVNAFSPNFILDLEGADTFLWHWHFARDFAEVLIARSIIQSLESVGYKVFPNVNTCWHYDDKIAQKYLLEAIRAPLAPTWIFYSLEEALNWVDHADFPKVFKLRRGASAHNVQMVESRDQARRMCTQAFTTGFEPASNYFSDSSTKIRKLASLKNLWQKLKRFPQSFLRIRHRKKMSSPEKGYIYFQEFMPRNDFDTRVVIIGQKALTMVRKNRPGDFRASGGGLKLLDPELIDPHLIELSFDVAEKLGSQSLAFDWVYDASRKPVILEISYSFVTKHWPGYWDKRLGWRSGDVWVQDLILENLLDN